MERPVDEMLRRAAGRLSGHMPGHKGQSPFGGPDLYALDTTELPTTDDLYTPERGLREAQRLYARAAGAGATLFLHNGSTQGIHAMLMLWAREGDTVLLPRNAHLSAANACVLWGLRVVWMPVTQLPDGSVHVSEDTVLRMMEDHPEARTVLVTRPDYFGCGIPLDRIAARAHALGMRLAVDEAHGAHLPWSQGMRSAGEAGADAWVQSVHKTLPGLTGSAVLQLRNGEDAPAALRCVRREQTSSPSFILMRSIDDSRAWMEEHGRGALSELTVLLDSLRGRLPTYDYADAHRAWREAGLETDGTRLVINAPQGGHRLAEQLADFGIDAEMADDRRTVLLFSAMTAPRDVMKLEEALSKLRPEKAELPSVTPLPPLPETVLPLRQAVMADSEAVRLSESAGRLAAVSAGLYPPGVPLVVPGERIPERAAALLMSAASQNRFGTEGDSILCVRQ